MSTLKSLLLKIALFSAFFIPFTGNASAAAPESYGQAYNLFVTEENRDQPVPLEKGIHVLESYLTQQPLNGELHSSEEMMNQRDLLIAFSRMEASLKGETLEGSDKEIYYAAWLNARRKGWLPNVNINYGTFQDFLYRHEVSEKHNDMAYHEGLVLSPSEITIERFGSMAEVNAIQGKLSDQLRKLKTEQRVMGDNDDDLEVLIQKLEIYLANFKRVEDEIKEREHPTNKIPNLPEDIKQMILDNDLNTVMDSITYNYANNIYNRQFNLVKGASQFNGRVFQPGEEISFTQVLKEGDGGLSGYLSGWVIKGDEEEWEYGGGLCGSATVFFTPAWRAGLEIVSRRGHSSYFSNLYPEDSMWADATIYFGYTDVIMKNNTNSPIMFYAQDNPEAKEITMYVIGNPVYTSVEIEGPYVSGHYGKYIRHMTLPDGTVISEPLETSYSRIY